MAAILRSKEMAARVIQSSRRSEEADAIEDNAASPSPAFQMRLPETPTGARGTPPKKRLLPTSRLAGDGCYFVNASSTLLWCREGTIENSPAFQRWVGRRKAASPEGTFEVQSHIPSFSSPFGTYVPCPMFPALKRRAILKVSLRDQGTTWPLP